MENRVQAGGGYHCGGHCLVYCLILLTDYYSWFFYTGITAYVIQMTFCIREVHIGLSENCTEVDDYYDDDEESRLRW